MAKVNAYDLCFSLYRACQVCFCVALQFIMFKDYLARPDLMTSILIDTQPQCHAIWTGHDWPYSLFTIEYFEYLWYCTQIEFDPCPVPLNI